VEHENILGHFSSALLNCVEYDLWLVRLNANFSLFVTNSFKDLIIQVKVKLSLYIPAYLPRTSGG
jgi:hypothetical protein